jgi:IS30 family transposase
MRSGGLRSYERRRSPLRLSLAESEEIALGVARGESATVIASGSGRAVSTITRRSQRSVDVADTWRVGSMQGHSSWLVDPSRRSWLRVRGCGRTSRPG